jgi:hypothetical protein
VELELLKEKEERQRVRILQRLGIAVRPSGAQPPERFAVTLDRVYTFGAPHASALDEQAESARHELPSSAASATRVCLFRKVKGSRVLEQSGMAHHDVGDGSAVYVYTSIPPEPELPEGRRPPAPPVLATPRLEPDHVRAWFARVPTGPARRPFAEAFPPLCAPPPPASFAASLVAPAAPGQLAPPPPPWDERGRVAAPKVPFALLSAELVQLVDEPTAGVVTSPLRADTAVKRIAGG